MKVIRYSNWDYDIVKREKLDNGLRRLYVRSELTLSSGHQIFDEDAYLDKDDDEQYCYIMESRYQTDDESGEMFQVLDVTPVERTEIDIKITIEGGIDEGILDELTSKLDGTFGNFGYARIKNWEYWNDRVFFNKG